MYDIFCTADDIAPTLSHQTRIFTMSHPLRAWQHIPCIRHHTHCNSVITPSPLTSHPLLYDIIPTFCVTSYELYTTSHPILMPSHYCTYDITDSIYETTSSMRATYTLNLVHHSHYLVQHPHCIGNITPTHFMTTNLPYMWHRVHYTRHHILTFWLQSTSWGHHTHYIRHHVHCICVITPIYQWYHSHYMYITSRPVHVRHSIHYIYDIVPTMYDITTLCVDYTTLGLCMTSFALQKTSHPLYHPKPQSVWVHIHFRHDITLPVSDITAALSLSSQPFHWYHTHFCMAWHPLYV